MPISFDLSYYAFSARVTNDVGYDVPTYATAKTLYGSVQVVPRTLYQHMGLDLQKNYINVYTSNAISDIKRNISGDQIAFNGSRYQCESITNWHGVDGWVSILCVEVPNA